MARVTIVVSDTDQAGQDVAIDVKYDPARPSCAPRHLTPAERIGAAIERQWSQRPQMPAKRDRRKSKPPARRPAVKRSPR